MSTATLERPAQATSLVRVPVAETALQTIEAIAMECALTNATGASHMTKALKMAAGIKALRRAMTDEVMQEIMELQGSSLGFRTDKDTGNGYSKEEVKECVIEHLLRGGHLVGNELNIIAKRAYQTKEFFTRMLRVFPGLTDLRLHPGVPTLANGGALVPYSATWRLFGQADRIDRHLTKLEGGTQLDERICVRVNQGMGADAILGKAERKIKAAIYNRLTGSDFTEHDPDDMTRVLPKPAQNMDDLANRLGGEQTDGTLGEGGVADVIDPAMLAKFDGCEQTSEGIEKRFQEKMNTVGDLKPLVAARDYVLAKLPKSEAPTRQKELVS